MALCKRLKTVTALMPFLLTQIAFAQAGYEAQIRGTVTDPGGGVVPGATVTLTDAATNIPVTPDRTRQR
jgi:type 1 fimbria pilin